MNNNYFLDKAKKNQADEFYTCLPEIEKELQYYTQYLCNKTIYMPCDTEKSNFVKYFKDNFSNLQLKEIIATSYVKRDLFNIPFNPIYNYYSYTGEKETRAFLTGDGSFDSKECIAIMKKADVIITNPPFSRFRHFVQLLLSLQKDFLIIGNLNSIITKNIARDIIKGNLRLGYTEPQLFYIPKEYVNFFNKKLSKKFNSQTNIVRLTFCVWLTNLPVQRERFIPKLNQHFNDTYKTYDNAKHIIHIEDIHQIPIDYYGYLAVPITYLKKHNPNDFNLIQINNKDFSDNFILNGKIMYKRIVIQKIKEYGENV